jgi:hypothetical protein
MEDIFCGVEELIQEGVNHHFLGTMIIAPQNEPDGIRYDDRRARPTRIDVIIDGQQRISSIILLACALYEKISVATNRLLRRRSNTTDFSLIANDLAKDNYLKNLKKFFSYTLNSGAANPPEKPKIIRCEIDQWTLSGNVNDNYNSDLSFFLAQFIQSLHNGDTKLPTPVAGTRVSTNYKAINSILKRVELAHTLTESHIPSFPHASQILRWSMSESSNRNEKTPMWDNLWNYDLSEYQNLIDSDPSDKYGEITQSHLCSLIQLLCFSYFLFDCCCLTSIEPKSEISGFDMFQSLNATGTPLTAVETFKPSVVGYLTSNNINFEQSETNSNYKKVEQLLKPQLSASVKNKLTNEFLTTFATTYTGEKLQKKFSKQLKWLNTKYSQNMTFEQREEFIRRMADLATYWLEVIDYQWSTSNSVLPRINDCAEAELATLCVLYLRDAGHTMAHSVLSRFYSQLIRGAESSKNEFIEACKAVVAFFTLWRSAYSTSGLDDVYRDLLSEFMSWEKGNSDLKAERLKHYLLDKLNQKGCVNRQAWRKRAEIYLTYENVREVCKFVLFISSHDTDTSPFAGLMEPARTGTSPYLTPRAWESDDLNSIEHIAPQKPEPGHDWDQGIYNEGRVERIGNLTLLPLDINISAANRSWRAKWIYYRHLAETNQTVLNELRNQAVTLGVNLADPTIERLQRSSYMHHMKPITTLNATQNNWNSRIIEARTKRICAIVWKRLYPWLTNT